MQQKHVREIKLGFSENKLLELCDKDNAVYDRFAPYWPVEVYGFGKYLKEFARYPSYLPAAVYMSHGVGGFHSPLIPELESDAPTQLYFSPKSTAKWRKISNKPVYTILHPYIYFRKKYNFKPKLNAKGTLAFPAHSTTLMKVGAYSNYCQDLLSLPRKLQPVSVCLHYIDILEGRHKIFFENNIPVYTAGYKSDYRFPMRFYKILQNFKYTTSNHVGSYLYYSIEMGIPFFIYGSESQYSNHGDYLFKKGRIRESDYSRESSKVADFFKVSDLSKEISINSNQKFYVNNELGVYHSVSSEELRKILFYSLLKFITSPRGLYQYAKRKTTALF